MTTPAQRRRAEGQIENVLADIKIVPLTAAVSKHPRSFERAIAYRMILGVRP